MSTDPKSTNPPRMAAGGIVWSNDGTGLRIAVVHRRKYDDWALPKGKVEPGEELHETALREVAEETGHLAALQAFAGSYGYLVNGAPKVVMVWHLVRLPETVKDFPDRNEIVEVLWVAPEEAIKRLTHSVERNFVATHCLGTRGATFVQELKSESKLDRLSAGLQRVRVEFESLVARDRAHQAGWWAQAAGKSLVEAEASLRAGNLDVGWGAVHNAERFMVFGLNDNELITRAIALQSETAAKLGGWRLQATTALFATLRLADKVANNLTELTPDDRLQCQHSLVEALSVLHGHGDNTYHRLHLVEDRLGFLVKACGALLIVVLAVAWVLGGPDDKWNGPSLFFVCLGGALGGVASAMYQLSRVGEAKIPEALLNDLITKGRPLVGAASALFIYIVMISGVISLIDPAKVTLLAGIALAFVAGFSEQFVLKTVARVAGATDSGKEPPTRVPVLVEGGDAGKPRPRKKPQPAGEAGSREATEKKDED